MTIVFILAILLTFVHIIYKNNIHNKEELIIYVNRTENELTLLLSYDEYLKLKIHNYDNIKEDIKTVVKYRAFELKNFVDRVTLINHQNGEFGNELLNIIHKN